MGRNSGPFSHPSGEESRGGTAALEPSREVGQPTVATNSRTEIVPDPADRLVGCVVRERQSVSPTQPNTHTHTHTHTHIHLNVPRRQSPRHPAAEQMPGFLPRPTAQPRGNWPAPAGQVDGCDEIQRVETQQQWGDLVSHPLPDHSMDIVDGQAKFRVQILDRILPHKEREGGGRRGSEPKHEHAQEICVRSKGVIQCPPRRTLLPERH